MLLRRTPIKVSEHYDRQLKMESIQCVTLAYVNHELVSFGLLSLLRGQS